MNSHGRMLGLLATLSILVTGCAATQAATPPAGSTPTPTQSMSPGMVMPPGMSMAPGMSMPGMTPAATVSPSSGDATAGPSASAQLVCGSEIKGDVATILALHPAPATTTTWANHLYTCTYHLSGGPLVLSVQESADVPSANTYFVALREHLGTTHPLVGIAGLGNPGYDTPGGVVVVLKDDKTLKVDATGLPPTSGPHQQSRADLAYEVASDVLGCWSGQ
jgi:hypothetical protein